LFVGCVKVEERKEAKKRTHGERKTLGVTVSDILVVEHVVYVGDFAVSVSDLWMDWNN
jgi:hypothetical protein